MVGARPERWEAQGWGDLHRYQATGLLGKLRSLKKVIDKSVIVRYNEWKHNQEVWPRQTKPYWRTGNHALGPGR